MAENHDTCKNITLIITLIITSCLVTRFINEKYVKPQESNNLMLEMREQLSNLQSTLFSLDEMRLAHAEKMDRLRREEDEHKRMHLWKNFVDLIHQHHPKKEVLATFAPKIQTRSTTARPIRNRLFNAHNAPSSQLIRALS